MADTLHSSLLIVGTAAAVYACVCGSWSTVLAHPHHTTIGRFRVCETVASVIVATHGVASAREQDSLIPFVVAVVMCGVFIAGYEWAVSHPVIMPDGTNPKNGQFMHRGRYRIETR